MRTLFAVYLLINALALTAADAAAQGKRDPNFIVIARTDARASEGLDAAIARAKAYVDAGAQKLDVNGQYAISYRDFVQQMKWTGTIDWIKPQ